MARKLIVDEVLNLSDLQDNEEALYDGNYGNSHDFDSERDGELLNDTNDLTFDPGSFESEPGNDVNAPPSNHNNASDSFLTPPPTT